MGPADAGSQPDLGLSGHFNRPEPVTAGSCPRWARKQVLPRALLQTLPFSLLLQNQATAGPHSLGHTHHPEGVGLSAFPISSQPSIGSNHVCLCGYSPCHPHAPPGYPRHYASPLSPSQQLVSSQPTQGFHSTGILVLMDLCLHFDTAFSMCTHVYTGLCTCVHVEARDQPHVLLLESLREGLLLT